MASLTKPDNLRGRRRQKARIRGVAATELAVVLPVLMLLALVGADFGRAGYYYLAIGNAARTGAEYGSQRNVTPFTRPSWEAQVRDATRAEVQGTDHLDGQQLQLDVQTEYDADGLFVVRVEAVYELPMLVNWPALPETITLRRAVSMRQIR